MLIYVYPNYFSVTREAKIRLQWYQKTTEFQKAEVQDFLLSPLL